MIVIWLSASALVLDSGGDAMPVLMVCGSRSLLLRPCPNCAVGGRRGRASADVERTGAVQIGQRVARAMTHGGPGTARRVRRARSSAGCPRRRCRDCSRRSSRPSRSAAGPCCSTTRARSCRSVVRWSSGIGISTALLNPKVPPNGMCAVTVGVLDVQDDVGFGVALKLTSASPILRIVLRSNCTA